MTWLKIPPGVSGSRQVGLSLLLLWAFLTIRHFTWIDVQLMKEQQDAWEFVTFFLVPIGVTPFGLDKVLSFVQGARRGSIIPKGQT
jgi:hypothetical protein